MKLADNPFYAEGRQPYAKRAKGPKQTWPVSFEERVSALEVELLCQALREAGGNIQFAADACGLSRSTFAFKMQKYALSAKDFK